MPASGRLVTKHQLRPLILLDLLVSAMIEFALSCVVSGERIKFFWRAEQDRPGGETSLLNHRLLGHFLAT
jgi:hypothetical protein